MEPFYERMDKKELHERWIYFENQAKLARSEADYYQTELAKAHELLGRVIHQTSERWDSVRLTKFYPTDNLFNRRTTSNPTGQQIAAAANKGA